MGCIQTYTDRIGGLAAVSTRRVTPVLALRMDRLGGTVRTQTARATRLLYPAVSRHGGALSIRASLVCTIDLVKKFVRIEPEYLWLTESNHFHAIVDVQSNTSWKAE